MQRTNIHYNPLSRAVREPAIITASPDTEDIYSPEPVTYSNPVSMPGNIDLPGNGVIGEVPLHPGYPDALSIIATLEQLSLQFGQQPFIREFTVNQVLGCMDHNNDLMDQVQAVFWFVQKYVNYIRDPLGTEYVIGPDKLISDIANGQKPRGDCDDHVLLLNSMLTSLGFETRVIGVKLFTQDRFDHVISSVLTPNGWLDLDPCAKNMAQPVYYERLETPR